MHWWTRRGGVFARLIFDTSYSPVREVAIAATLGLLAGVCGRAYRTYMGKDLALYLILVAKSGIGKDSTHDGIPMLLKLASVPMGERFVRAQDFVSGEALHKEVLREPGFLALQGEFGRKLKRMSNPTDTPMKSLRTVMTNAYGIPASYKVPDAMRQGMIVPRSYLQRRAASLPAFNNHRFGATRALDDTLASLVMNGNLMEAQKDKVIEAYGFFGRTYRVLSLPD